MYKKSPTYCTTNYLSTSIKPCVTQSGLHLQMRWVGNLKILIFNVGVLPTVGLVRKKKKSCKLIRDHTIRSDSHTGIGFTFTVLEEKHFLSGLRSKFDQFSWGGAILSVF